MMEMPDTPAQLLAHYKSSFDEAFAKPPAEAGRKGTDFLLITAGERPYAIRLAELAGLEAVRRIVPVPAPAPALLGLCGIHGQLMPVFHLATVLGHAARGEPARWLALHHDKEWIAMALDRVEGARHVDEQDIHQVELGVNHIHLSRQAIQVESRLIHVVDMTSVISSVRRAAHVE